MAVPQSPFSCPWKPCFPAPTPLPATLNVVPSLLSEIVTVPTFSPTPVAEILLMLTVTACCASASPAPATSSPAPPASSTPNFRMTLSPGRHRSRNAGRSGGTQRPLTWFLLKRRRSKTRSALPAHSQEWLRRGAVAARPGGRQPLRGTAIQSRQDFPVKTQNQACARSTLRGSVSAQAGCLRECGNLRCRPPLFARCTDQPPRTHMLAWASSTRGRALP